MDDNNKQKVSKGDDMAQFYFLSILLNFFAALVLIYGTNFVEGDELEEENTVKSTNRSKAKKEIKEKAEKAEKKMKSIIGKVSFFDKRTFRLIVGILCAFTGFMLLLTPFKGDVPVVGDLISVIAGLAGGASILLEYYISGTTEEPKVSEKVIKIFIGGRKYIGVLCIFAALLHFIFPGVLLL